MFVLMAILLAISGVVLGYYLMEAIISIVRDIVKKVKGEKR